jgi:phosphoribosyl-AMP cyclohydrolase
MKIEFKSGLLPVIVQDNSTCEVLMLAYTNEEALMLTRDTGYAHYYSRSRGKLWKKGEKSGHFQRVVRILVDCDEDTLLYQVEQQGAACHTGHMSCFYRTIEGEEISGEVFDPERVYANKGE